VTISGIIPALSRASAFDRVLRAAPRDADFSVVDGLRVPLLAALMAERKEPQCVLVITATAREAEAVRGALTSYLPDARLLEFPAWETLPHERLSPSAQTVGTRIATLRALQQWQDAPAAERQPTVVVASVRAALQPIASNLTSLEPVVLRTDSRGNDLGSISAQLVDLAYARVDLVTRRGEFAVRGGILDVFPPTADHPVRVDFFGDEIEAIRPSPSPTSAPPRTTSAPSNSPRPANSCSARTSGSAPARCCTSSRTCRRCSPRWQRASRWRAWSPSPRPSWSDSSR